MYCHSQPLLRLEGSAAWQFWPRRGHTRHFLPFRSDRLTSVRRRRSTKWRLHTKNIYRIHTTSPLCCSQGSKRSELKATHFTLTIKVIAGSLKDRDFSSKPIEILSISKIPTATVSSNFMHQNNTATAELSNT